VSEAWILDTVRTPTGRGDELERRDHTPGLVTLCFEGCIGTATPLERLAK